MWLSASIKGKRSALYFYTANCLMTTVNNVLEPGGELLIVGMDIRAEGEAQHCLIFLNEGLHSCSSACVFKLVGCGTRWWGRPLTSSSFVLVLNLSWAFWSSTTSFPSWWLLPVLRTGANLSTAPFDSLSSLLSPWPTNGFWLGLSLSMVDSLNC